MATPQKMRKFQLWWNVLLLVALLMAGWFSAGQAQEAGRTVLVMEARGAVSAGMADYLDRGLRTAVRRNAEALVLQLDTPGGAVDITSRMVQAIRNNPTPVIVYVAPRGAIAGSAGTVITLSGHLAAMAPETAIGAASPVDMGGADIEEVMERKVKEIQRAEIRSLTAGRPPEAVRAAEETIESARALSAHEALSIGLIDIIAEDVDDLLAQADGRVVRLAQEVRVLDLQGVEVQQLPENFLERILALISNPNIVFLLLAVGVQAILIELLSPGGWFAGTLGAIFLALSIYGMGLLPVNWFGLLFIALAFALFVLELKTANSGALTAAGVASLIAGGLILFNTQQLPGLPRISLPMVVATAILSGLSFIAILGVALRARTAPIRAGQEALIGRSGVVKEDLDPRGMVRVGGELWSAEIASGAEKILKDERVRVIGLDGNRLLVEQVGEIDPANNKLTHN